MACSVMARRRLLEWALAIWGVGVAPTTIASGTFILFRALRFATTSIIFPAEEHPEGAPQAGVYRPACASPLPSNISNELLQSPVLRLLGRTASLKAPPWICWEWYPRTLT